MTRGLGCFDGVEGSTAAEKSIGLCPVFTRRRDARRTRRSRAPPCLRPKNKSHEPTDARHEFVMNAVSSWLVCQQQTPSEAEELTSTHVSFGSHQRPTHATGAFLGGDGSKVHIYPPKEAELSVWSLRLSSPGFPRRSRSLSLWFVPHRGE